ncbi:hypothetical protein [Enterococcus devriesei]|uniref:hypothetical protein n=1 Tax=Enterococcus devriesei TaxID=319970 RepID=UPI0028ADD33B|nr:hypothetical protein [Enterococcus devriesei]
MEQLGKQLSGTWLIKGTTFPLWLSNKRNTPRITYRVLEKEPLKLLDLVEYEKKGKTKQIIGVDYQREKGFLWRGNGPLKILKSRWEVVTIKGDVLVIRFAPSLVTPAGVDILVREGAVIPDLAKRVVQHFAVFGLTAEEIRTIQWK